MKNGDVLRSRKIRNQRRMYVDYYCIVMTIGTGILLVQGGK